jgi:hypothetical protein
MDKADREFIMKVSAQAAEALRIATDTRNRLELYEVAKVDPAPATQSDTIKTITNPEQPTQTWVQFSTPAELQLHAGQIAALNKDIDRICKQLNIKELRITFKKT